MTSRPFELVKSLMKDRDIAIAQRGWRMRGEHREDERKQVRKFTPSETPEDVGDY